jgi:hypothetical protein
MKLKQSSAGVSKSQEKDSKVEKGVISHITASMRPCKLLAALYLM